MQKIIAASDFCISLRGQFGLKFLTACKQGLHKEGV